MPEVFAFMALGILLLRNGFLTGRWTRQSYLIMIAIGYLIALPLNWSLGEVLRAGKYDPATTGLCDAAALILRPSIAIAHAATVILILQSGRAVALMDRVSAAGRMALSNYLATTLIATTLFYGYGFGMFGQLGRAQLYLVAGGIWVFMLIWSKPWLARFQYGPAEWAWRSLARWQLQRIRSL